MRAPPRPDYLLRLLTTHYMPGARAAAHDVTYLSPYQVRVPPMTGIRFEIEPDPRHWLHLVQIPEETTADE